MATERFAEPGNLGLILSDDVCFFLVRTVSKSFKYLPRGHGSQSSLSYPRSHLLVFTSIYIYRNIHLETPPRLLQVPSLDYRITFTCESSLKDGRLYMVNDTL